MTEQFIRNNLPVIGDSIVWPEIKKGIRIETVITDFLNMFISVEDDLLQAKQYSDDNNLGFGPYIQAVINEKI